MAICPTHGAYSGNSCKKCAPSSDPEPRRDFVPPDEENKHGLMPRREPGGASIPEIDIHDKYLLSRAHSEFLSAHIKTVQAQEHEKAFQDNLRNTTKAVFERMQL